jgi:hypothetical protein
MKALFDSGALIDVALIVIALELAALIAFRSRIAQGLRPLDIFGQLAAGALLLLGVRCAVIGSDYRWTLLCLTASFPAHLFDLSRRARSLAKT